MNTKVSTGQQRRDMYNFDYKLTFKHTGDMVVRFTHLCDGLRGKGQIGTSRGWNGYRIMSTTGPAFDGRTIRILGRIYEYDSCTVVIPRDQAIDVRKALNEFKEVVDSYENPENKLALGDESEAPAEGDRSVPDKFGCTMKHLDTGYTRITFCGKFPDRLRGKGTLGVVNGWTVRSNVRPYIVHRDRRVGLPGTAKDRDGASIIVQNVLLGQVKQALDEMIHKINQETAELCNKSGQVVRPANHIVSSIVVDRHLWDAQPKGRPLDKGNWYRSLQTVVHEVNGPPWDAQPKGRPSDDTLDALNKAYANHMCEAILKTSESEKEKESRSMANYNVKKVIEQLEKTRDAYIKRAEEFNKNSLAAAHERLDKAFAGECKFTDTLVETVSKITVDKELAVYGVILTRLNLVGEDLIPDEDMPNDKYTNVELLIQSSVGRLELPV